MKKLTRKDFQPIYFRVDSKALLLDGEIVPIGEPLTAEMILGQTGRAPKGGFDIVRLPLLNAGLKRVCGKQGKVLAYLFENRTYENCVDKTNAKIVAATGVSTSTVVRMIDALEDEGLVVQTRGKLLINPRMIHKGDNVREATMFDDFEQAMKEQKKGDYAEKKENSGDENK